MSAKDLSAPTYPGPVALDPSAKHLVAGLDPHDNGYVDAGAT
jgi:hypothetical protein